MKIISKYKDYYDYLQGIYGVDEKLVLDRRESDHYDFTYSGPCTVNVHICGVCYSGYYDGDGKFYYGKNLLKIGKEREIKDYSRYSWFRNTEKKRSVDIKIQEGYLRGRYDYGDYINIDIEPKGSKINEKEDCPIVVSITGRDLKFLPLNHIQFGSMLSPEDIFLKLSSYLSAKITENETITDSRTEVERIESRGFDKKRSFRPKMK